MEAPTGASGHLCPSVAPLQASIPQGCSSLYPLSWPPCLHPRGLQDSPAPTQSPRTPSALDLGRDLLCLWVGPPGLRIPSLSPMPIRPSSPGPPVMLAQALLHLLFSGPSQEKQGSPAAL